MLKVNAALWVNNGFTSCVAFDHKAHRHSDEQQVTQRATIAHLSPRCPEGQIWYFQQLRQITLK